MPVVEKPKITQDFNEAIIGSSIYKVIHTDENIVAHGDHCYGSHEAMSRTIKITTDDEVNIQQKENTLLHEIIHAIDTDRNLDMKEDQIGGVSTGLYQVMRDNKELLNSFTFGS